MSRIEIAMEKAAQLRNGLPPAEAPASLHGAAVPLKRQAGGRSVTIDPGNPLVTILADPHSPVSEQYRKLKSRLVLLTTGQTFRNLIMVTSAVAGEGKSMTAANLAISIAQEYDKTVLLVDADLRRPRVHSYLGFEQSAGLSDCLLDGIDIGDAIVKTDLDKLSVLTAGREVAKPLELFASRKMQGLMAEIKNRYTDRYVIIDTPPLLPFAETRSLAHVVDGIVMVVHEGVTPQQNVREAMEILKGCPVLGIVLNDSTAINLENSHYGKYYDRKTV